jgi:DNA-binding NtrC family response regulator
MAAMYGFINNLFPHTNTVMANSVLIVEDEPNMRQALQDILEIAGLKAISAANGEEGIAAFIAHHDEIGLVILDVRLPGKSGADTLKALQAIEPDVKVIVSSGYDENRISPYFKEQPRVVILKKPYNAEMLLTTVHHALYH